MIRRTICKSQHPEATLMCFALAAVILANTTLAGAQVAPQANPASGSSVGGNSGGISQSGPTLSHAQILARQHRWEEAESTVRQFLQAEPKSGGGHALLGFILFQRNQPAQSLQEFSTEVSLQAPDALDLKIVGLDYAMQDDYKNAEKWLQKSLAMNPADTQTCKRLGEVKYTEQHYEETIAVFKSCLQQDPKDSFAETAIGASYEALNQPEDAIAAYQRAIALEEQKQKTRDATPFYDLGTLLLKQNRAEEAMRYLRKGAILEPSNANLHAKLGEAESALGRLSQAEAELRRAISLAPENGQLHFILAQIYRKLGQQDQARAELERYQTLVKENTGAPTQQH